MAQKMKIVYVDMDNVLVNFQSGIDSITEEERESFKDDLDDVPGIFSKMKPVEGAIEAYQELTRHFEVYILSTAPWNNPSAWPDKLLWVK
jgi:5'(3')-deoxyribonucleotidase